MSPSPLSLTQMPDLVLPQKRPLLQTLVQSILGAPIFWYFKTTPWFVTFLKNFILLLEDRLAITLMGHLIFTPLFRDPSIVGRLVGVVYRLLRVLLGALGFLLCVLILLLLFVVWLLFPPVCLYQSLQKPSYLIFLVLAAIAVLVWQARRPRKRISEVKDEPVINIEDVATRKVLQVSLLDSVKFLTTAHRFPRLENLLRRLEVETPLKVSGGAVQVFRSQKVWQIAFEEAVKTNSDYLRLEHIFFGVLGFEEMKEVTEGLGIKIEDVHEIIKWLQKQEKWSRPPKIWSADFEFKGRGGVNRSPLAPVTPSVSGFEQTLEILEYEAWNFEKDRQVTISYPALLAAIKMAAKFFHDRVLPDKAIDLLDETVSRVVKVNGNFVGSEDVAKLVSEKINVPVTQITAEESETAAEKNLSGEIKKGDTVRINLGWLRV